MPELAKNCIASWHKYMPDYEYKLWNEDGFDVNSTSYTKEAYEARKFAFVSDYVRLWVLNKEGGIYFDTDVEVFKPFDDLLSYKAFAGFEGSKHLPVGTCVMASEAGGEWIKEQLNYYNIRHFLNADGSFDLTTNVQFMNAKMCEQGFMQNGSEQDFKDVHIFPVDYFSPRHTTGEYIRTKNTYCEHLGLASWSANSKSWKGLVRKIVGQKSMICLIKLKRKIFS